MTAEPSNGASTRTYIPLVAMFALLVGLAFFARHVAGSALAGANYNALYFNVAAVTTPKVVASADEPNDLLWDETFGYARYVQQLRRGDWFGNTFQTYARFAAKDSKIQSSAHYPFFFDRSGLVVVWLLTRLTGDVPRAFALADLIFPALVAVCAVAFCLQLRRSLAFAVLAAACFMWFNWSDTATWLGALRDNAAGDGMLFSRTPYPQLAMATFLLFAIGLLRAQKTPNRLWTLLLALALALNAVTYIYSWTLALAATGMMVVLFLIQKPLALQLERNFLFACVGALGASVLLSAPVWIAYVLAPDIARDTVTRFAEERVSTPDLVTRTLVLVVQLIPLLVPWLQNMSSRAFWLAFWLGGIVAYNQHLVTGIMVQPAHYPPYYFGTFAMIYLLDLALAIWERLTPKGYARANARILVPLAVLVALGGFAAITWRNVSLARAQIEYNRTNASMMQLVTTLNQLDGDYIVLTTDEYLHRLLPAYVKQPFVLPILQDPLTNGEVTTIQDSAARLLGYADWNAWEKNKPSAPPQNVQWGLDASKVIVLVNRHRPNRMPTKFSKTLLENQDYIVGIEPVQ